MQLDRAKRSALVSLIFNIVYCTYHIILGVVTASRWFLAIGIYYAVLSTIRFTVLRYKGDNRALFQFTGTMLMGMSVLLAGTVILAFVKDRGTEFPLVAMLTIATYTFTKITLATIKWIKARGSRSVKLITLRNISFANAFVSVYSLQRSMLVSFDGMTKSEICIMNLATGTAVCIIVFILGLNLVLSKLELSDE